MSLVFSTHSLYVRLSVERVRRRLLFLDAANSVELLTFDNFTVAGLGVKLLIVQLLLGGRESTSWNNSASLTASEGRVGGRRTYASRIFLVGALHTVRFLNNPPFSTFEFA